VVKCDAIPDGWMGLDIGPETIAHFQAVLGGCKTVIWNGPMGVFEFPAVRLKVLVIYVWRSSHLSIASLAQARL
jgi:3-phosphoglycerate kinase